MVSVDDCLLAIVGKDWPAKYHSGQVLLGIVDHDRPMQINHSKYQALQGLKEVDAVAGGYPMTDKRGGVLSIYSNWSDKLGQSNAIIGNSYAWITGLSAVVSMQRLKTA